MKLSREINGWLMVLVVLVTACITVWVMLRNRPNQNWNSRYYYPPQQVAGDFSPGITAMNICTDCHPVISTIPNIRPSPTLPHDHRGICSNCHRMPNPLDVLPMTAAGQVAGATVPVIRAGAVPLHADRGACTNCHTVVSSRGNPIPDISATSTSPHENRGVCSNCHLLANPSGLNANMGSTLSPIPMAAVRPVVVPMTTAPSGTATEGEWMGLEVAPITSLTAGQYKIPDGTRGLVVVEVESQAAAAGLKVGDVVLSINGAPIYNMTDFFQATRNGTMTQGVVEILRKGQKLAANIAQTINPAPFAVPSSSVNAPPGGMPAAMPTPQGGTSTYPGNAAGWNGGQGLGNLQGWGPGAVCPKQF